MEKSAFFSFLFICDFNFPFHYICLPKITFLMHGKISVVCLEKFHCMWRELPTYMLYFFSLSGGCGLWLFHGSPGRGMQRYDARTSAQTSGQTF
jgi:hypothetical protein